MKRYAYLLCVDSNENHNKFYEITENDNGSLDIVHGRVGAAKPMHKHYESWEKDFVSLKSSKEAKGYQDRTSLHAEKTDVSQSAVDELSYQPVEDPVVQAALERVIQASRMFMKQNYTVKAQDVTPKMLNEAALDIQRLNDIAARNSPCALYDFNKTLQELFTDVPRAMQNVKAYLAETTADFDKIISRETKMYDNLKGIVGMTVQAAQKGTNTDKNMTVLEAHGMTMRQVNYAEEDRITKHLGEDYFGTKCERRFVRAFAVENLETRKRYEQFKKDHDISPKEVKLFYHGSKVENFYSIMQTGLSLNPDARVTGKMFGQGLYFAPECRKALNYMDVSGARWNSGTQHTGYTAIFSVALGKAYEPDHVLGSGFTSRDLPHGCTSVFASKRNPHLHLKNDEYIVFNQDACTIKYLMEMTEHNVPELNFTVNRDALRNALIDAVSPLEKIDSNTFRAEILLDKLPKAALNELNNKIVHGADCERLVMEVNFDSGHTVFAADGISPLMPSLTKDDYKFLVRELKKNFAEGEFEFSKLMQEAKEMQIGDIMHTRSERESGLPTIEEPTIEKNEREIG